MFVPGVTPALQYFPKLTAKPPEIKPTHNRHDATNQAPAKKPAPDLQDSELLFNFDSRARIGELLPDCFRFFLGHAFFDGLRCSFDQILRFFQTESGHFANDLDDVDLVSASRLKNDVKLSL